MNNKSIKVSVVVPVYNTEAYVSACLESLLSQSLEEIEIIVINDGSTDKSREIIGDYQKSNPDKIIVLDKVNGGQASARNLGLKHCRGRYIGFVDSDDTVNSEMYAQMYEKAIAEQADMVECDYSYRKIENNRQITLIKYAPPKIRKNRKELFIDPLASPWNKLYRAEIIMKSGVLFPEGVIYEDTAFYIELIPWLNKTVFLPEEYVIHYLRENSTQNKKQNPKVGDMLVVIDHIIQYYHANGFWETYREELEYFCVKIMLCSSLGRIALLKDKTLKENLLGKMDKILNTNYPEFRKNRYFTYGIRNIYIKSCSPGTIRLYARIIGRIYRIKMSKNKLRKQVE